jgi:hypothetical protein
MNALVLANFPVAALIFAAIVGIPLWLTFKHPDRALRDTGARAYSGAAAVPVQAAPARARQAAGPRVSTRLSTGRQHMAARTAVPGRRPAAAARTARPAAQQARTPGPHDHAAV